MKKKSDFVLSEQEIITAIHTIKQKTSGNITLKIDKKCPENALKKAINVFEKLNLSSSPERNEVLIYVATKSKRFAIIGDKGIQTVLPDNFWEATKDIMRMYFKRNDLTQGLLKGIKMIGKQLEKHFPVE